MSEACTRVDALVEAWPIEHGLLDPQPTGKSALDAVLLVDLKESTHKIQYECWPDKSSHNFEKRRHENPAHGRGLRTAVDTSTLGLRQTPIHYSM